MIAIPMRVIKIDYKEPDNKLLLHNLNEREQEIKEQDPEKFNYELKHSNNLIKK